MKKIVFIGAGSIIFVKNLIGDCLLTPCLSDAEIALVDIDARKLALSHTMLQTLNENINGGRAHITATTDRRSALAGADFVINAIQVGGYDPCVVNDFEISKRFGLKQTYADTLGIGGIFRGLRTIPVVSEFALDIEDLCPDAWLLNYVNPMCIVTGYMQRYTNIHCVGLCHSVQVCTRDLLAGLGMDAQNVSDKIAGINHQAWLLEVKRGKVDLYPEIRRRAAQRPATHDDLVRYEVMSHFGYYVTESSQHSAEYMPYFIKRTYPELIEQLGIKTEMYLDWGASQKSYWEKVESEFTANRDLSHERTEEFASYIMEAMTLDRPCRIAGNVINEGYIDNLPQYACVEVPAYVSADGIHPARMGALPPQCAAMNLTNINVQELTIQAAVTGDFTHVYHAAMMDPHTAAELSLDDITKLCDALFEANREWLPMFG